MENDDVKGRYQKAEAAWLKNFITVLRTWLSFAATQPGRSEEVRYILKVIGELTRFMTEPQLDVLTRMLDECDKILDGKEQSNGVGQ